MPVVVTRASNNYGPNQFPEKVIPLFITNAMDDHQVPLYGDGLNVRDWLHVSDNCRALDIILESGTPGEVYNIGGGNHVKNVDLTRRILQLLGKPETLIRPVADRLGHDRRYSVDTAKLHGLGWKPRIAFEQGLADTVAWYQQERVVVAADQGSRPGLQGLLQDAIRRTPELRRAWPVCLSSPAPPDSPAATFSIGSSNASRLSTRGHAPAAPDR